MPDMRALVRALLPGPDMLLRPETIKEMMRNQLADGRSSASPCWGRCPARLRLGGAVTLADAVRPSEFDGRIPVGRRRRHTGSSVRGANLAGIVAGATLHGLLEPILLRIQAARLPGGGLSPLRN